MTLPAIRSYRGTTNSAFDNMFGCSADEAKTFKGAHSIASFGKFRDQTDLNNNSALTPMQITNTWKKNLSVIGNNPEKVKNDGYTETFYSSTEESKDKKEEDSCVFKPLTKMHNKYHEKLNKTQTCIISVIVSVIVLFIIVFVIVKNCNKNGPLCITGLGNNCVL